MPTTKPRRQSFGALTRSHERRGGPSPAPGTHLYVACPPHPLYEGAGAHQFGSWSGRGGAEAAGILAEMGPVDRFYSDDELARSAGLTWRRDQSGAFEADDRPLTRRGNRYLRYYLCEAANSVRVHEPGLRSYYARKLQETQRHPHKRALVLSARHPLRTLYAMLKRGEPFNPGRRTA